MIPFVFPPRFQTSVPSRTACASPCRPKAGTPYYVAPQVTGVGIFHGDVMILLYEKCGEDDPFFHISINIKVK